MRNPSSCAAREKEKSEYQLTIISRKDRHGPSSNGLHTLHTTHNTTAAEPRKKTETTIDRLLGLNVSSVRERQQRIPADFGATYGPRSDVR